VNLIQSDPIFGSLTGGPDIVKINTPEAILERDLESRKPVKWTYESDQYPTTEDSWKWAEKKLKKKLEIPEMPDDEKDKNMAKYNTDENQAYDEDVTTTLGNALYSEKEYGYRNGYHYPYNNNSTDGNAGVKSFNKKGVSGTSWEITGDWRKNQGGYYWNRPQHVDWWNHLIKDQADGMINSGLTINDLKKDPRF